MGKIYSFVLFFLLIAAVNSQAAPILITDSSDAALTDSVVIDFNDAAISTFSSRTFDNFVTFSASNNGSLYIENTYSGLYGASGNYLANRMTPGPFTINFEREVSAFGFSWGAADQPWVMNLYNTNDQLLGALNINAQTNPYVGFIGGTDPSDSIAYAVIDDLSYYNYDYFILDNFQYVEASSSAPVPEPATLILLGSGLLGMAGFRKKNIK